MAVSRCCVNRFSPSWRAFCAGRRVGDEGLGRGTFFLNGIVQIINTLTPSPSPTKKHCGRGESAHYATMPFQRGRLFRQAARRQFFQLLIRI
jgi:hypothetical protein